MNQKTYPEKIRDIVSKMKATDYKDFDGDQKDALEYLEDNLTAFPEYVGHVARMETMGPIWRVTLDPEEWRDRWQDMDSRRRSKHEIAIGSANKLNRLCSDLDLPPFMEIDTTDRYAVADAAEKFTMEMFESGQPKRQNQLQKSKEITHERRYTAEDVKSKVDEIMAKVEHENEDQYEP